MNKDSITDYLACILFKLLGPAIRFLPLGVSFFLGRRLGDLFYYFDQKHRALAYNNIRAAFLDKFPPPEIGRITKKFYRVFGQNFVEILLIPSVEKKYLDEYVSIEGLAHIWKALGEQKGLILLSMHAGNWEFTNIISANVGFPYNLFVREQRLPRLSRLLNTYRRQKGCRIIQRDNQTRQLIQVLKNNEAIGMSLDQGGKTGIPVKFFGKTASMASGAVRIALKYGTVILPVFLTRVKGPYLKVIVNPALEVTKTDDPQDTLKINLEKLARIFEGYIEKCPQEYLWTYKIWKYSDERKVLILSDAKAGHVKQSQALAGVVKNYLKGKGITAGIGAVEVKFKNKFSRFILTAAVYLSGKYSYRCCLWFLNNFLKQDTYDALMAIKPDLIISAGSSLSALNVLLARYNLCRSIAIMRPPLLNTNNFDLVIMPQHDRFIQKKNVVVTEGALNLVDEEYLREQADKLVRVAGSALRLTGRYIGLLIGGDTKNFCLSRNIVSDVIKQVKSISETMNTDILAATSRRTSPEVEFMVRHEFKDYTSCKLLVLANEKNIPEAVGGILGLSEVIVVSPESISMISEAVNSKKYVVVFNAPGLSRKHRRSLEYFAKNKYIYLTQAPGLAQAIEEIIRNRPQAGTFKDNLLVEEALKKVL